MNSVHLIGIVKFEPRLNTFRTGTSKASAIIETPPADGQQYGDKVDVVAWNDQAMDLADMEEGDAVEIHGRLRTESWDDKTTGQKRYKMVCVASSVASPAKNAPCVAGGVESSHEEVPF